MSEEIFRKKSLDKVKSPESLNDYIQVSNPGVWLLLVSVIVLLLGVCIWCVIGQIESTANADVRAKDGSAGCYIADDKISSVRVGMTVKFGDFEATITKISSDDKGSVCTLESEQTIPDGLYEGIVIIESIKPISFILN